MGLVNIVILVGFAVLTVAVSLTVARLMQYREAAGTPREEIDLARYAPMGRLLDPEEAAFLAAQPGTTPQQIRAFRQTRRRIFRGYLRELSADFQSLHAEARQIVAESPEKSPELVETLVRQQAQFWISIARLEGQLLLDAAGVGHVDPRRLLDAVEALNAAVARATAAPGPIAVR